MITKPRPNVVVQLCSIECDFGVPLNDTSSAPNVAFRTDIIGWSNITDRLYIWDYVTNFQNYVMPWPNYYTIAPNIRFYIAHGAKGIYEEGPYQGPGSDLQEMKAYLVSRLMWDPALDDKSIMAEFLSAYYGPIGAPCVQGYIDACHTSMVAVGGMGAGSIDCPHTAPYLTPSLMLSQAAAFVQAITTLGPSSVVQPRLRLALLPVMYVVMLRWAEMQAHASAHSIPWVLGTLLQCFNDFSAVYVANDMVGLSEGGHDLPWLKQAVGL